MIISSLGLRFYFIYIQIYMNDNTTVNNRNNDEILLQFNQDIHEFE